MFSCVINDQFNQLKALTKVRAAAAAVAHIAMLT
jgi:hypothetical protein